jgi:multiple sugar transport system permease protein
MGALEAGIRKKSHSIERRESLTFYLMISPWIIGFLVFTLIPMAASAVLSFMEWDYIADPVFKGLGNYISLFRDEYFYISLRVTVIYSIFSVPLSLTVAFILALLLNARIRGLSVFRTLFYLPSLVSGAASSILWLWMFNPEFGVINTILGYVGIRGPEWIFNKYWALPSLIIMSLWGVGASMLIYLSGLQGIPTELYEAARIDGASKPAILFRITLPMMSSVIFYNLIIGIIGTFQTFTQAYVMTSGGPSYATYFYVYYLYNNAFKNFKIGYASSQAWILFFIIMILTLSVFRSSSMWVYYETEAKKMKKRGERKNGG